MSNELRLLFKVNRVSHWTVLQNEGADVMRILKMAATLGAAAGLMGSTVAMAAPATRANTALPTANKTVATNGVRTSAAVKKDSKLSSTGYVVAALAAAAVVGGIVAAASSDSNADSPG
ncbi:hypothetical protein [Stakelama marina]|uniref:Uncharacterized protein n=1 Tax=Stakelama marina TaxID=2826939 RepID=A0A8T4IIT4_9SPHN|nr:hypothetical protein [Stakelama marina]MBR0552096.1 hypothetical protein [Stakelama marina]